MAAANTDKFRKKKNLFSTNLNGSITDSDTTLTADSLSGVPTDTAVTVTIDRVDANSTSTPSYREDVTGVVSGSTITNLLRGQGATTAQSHADNAVLEITWETETWNDAVDGILVAHNQDGTHKSGSVLTLPQINDTSSDHQYVFSVCELVADRTVALPLLTGNDEFVFKDHTQTLTNKTLTSPKVGTAITDTNGNEVIKTPATSSAVNEITITNAAAGNGVLISATGGDTDINLNIQPKGAGDVQILDGNGNEVIKGAETASAVNEITVTNAATGGTPSITATGGDTNIHLTLSGKGNGLVKKSVLRQDDTTNSYAVNQVTLTGWGFIASGTDVGSKAVTFGVTFATAPIVVISGIGYKSGSDPSSIGDFSNDALHNVAAAGISTTGFTAYERRVDAGSSAGYRYGFSWIAIGTLS